MPYQRAQAKRCCDAIRKALFQEWDPIGVRDLCGPEDEYDSYVMPLYELLLQRSPVQRIFEYLWWLETEHMGLPGDRQRTLHFAERLARLPDELGGSSE